MATRNTTAARFYLKLAWIMSPASVFAAWLGIGPVDSARAQDSWPSQRIQMIVPASAGSGTDIMARKMAEQLALALKQPFVIENRAGASGVIGTSAVAKAPPDGYTLLYTNASFAVMAPAVLKSVPYDPARDLVPIAQTVVGGVLLLANKDLPAKNLRELIALVKGSPQTYSYGTWATGSSGHLVMERLKKQTGMQLPHVAYRAVPQLITDLVSGAVKIGWADPTSPLPFLQSGELRGIAISGKVRPPQVPDIATMGEQGYPFESVGWYGIFAPAGTPATVVARLTDEVNKIQGSADMAKLMNTLNMEPPPVKTQAQFNEIVLSDLVVWKKLAAEAGVVLDN